ncbi:MAG: murein biosynthesis integral membrane protein MurJ [Clostridiales bacterium]|jgi:putative peptidoglycan lipid II flippase|nr:murein biosynthesis integral membrane protein MurJ [Clostridiales bacterium]
MENGQPQDSVKNGVKIISVMMVLVLVAKFSGFVRDIVTLRMMGTTPESQAFTLALTIPNNFLDVAFAAAISASFIPVFNGYMEKKSRQEAFDVANNFITFVIILSLAASLIGFFASDAIAAAFLAGGGAETAALAGRLLRILIFIVFTTTTAFALTGVLQSLGGFYMPSIMSLIPNVMILIYLALFFERIGVFGLAAAFIIGNILQLAILIPPLRKRGFRFRPRLDLRDGALRTILRLSPMFLVAAWLFPINNLIHSWVIPNRYNPEALVELRAANTIYLVLTGFFVLSVTNVLFPKLSKEAAKASMGKDSDFSTVLSGAISAITFFLMPMAVGLWLLREPIARLAFVGGQFTEASAAQVAYALGFLSLGMLGFGLTTLLSRAFFASMNGKIPMIASTLAIVINFAASMLLVGYLGIGGVALAQAASVTAAGLTMLAVISRKHPVMTKSVVANLVKIGFAAIFMAFLLYIVMWLLSGLPYIVIIGMISLLGLLTYFAIGMALDINEAEIAKNMILARFKRRQEK